MLSMALPPATFVFEPFESEFSCPRNAAFHMLFRCNVATIQGELRDIDLQDKRPSDQAACAPC